MLNGGLNLYFIGRRNLVILRRADSCRGFDLHGENLNVMFLSLEADSVTRSKINNTLMLIVAHLDSDAVVELAWQIIGRRRLDVNLTCVRL